MLFRKYRQIVVDEKDVTTVLFVVNRQLEGLMDFIYESPHADFCGWKDENKWFVGFHASNKQMTKIFKKLESIGKFTVIETGLYFEKD